VSLGGRRHWSIECRESQIVGPCVVQAGTDVSAAQSLAAQTATPQSPHPPGLGGGRGADRGHERRCGPEVSNFPHRTGVFGYSPLRSCRLGHFPSLDGPVGGFWLGTMGSRLEGGRLHIVFHDGFCRWNAALTWWLSDVCHSCPVGFFQRPSQRALVDVMARVAARGTASRSSGIWWRAFLKRAAWGSTWQGPAWRQGWYCTVGRTSGSVLRRKIGRNRRCDSTNRAFGGWGQCERKLCVGHSRRSIRSGPGDFLAILCILHRA
jgi:hypothetical protein